MKITLVHLDLWQHRKRPTFASQFKKLPPNIDACINAQADAKLDHEAHIFFTILKMANKRGGAGDLINKLILQPHSTDSVTRQTWARRIYRRYYAVHRTAHHVKQQLLEIRQPWIPR